jgi:short-subunit dehydrogenase
MPKPIALVTGASSGIGADLSRELARDGYDLVLAARGVEAMQKLAAELDATSTILAADLSKPGAAAELAREIEARDIEIDTLINNAGLGGTGAFAESDASRISEMLEVNVVALTELTRALLPGMIARKRGRIMLVASTAAFQPGPFMAVYYATKAYVLSLGEAIAWELRGTGVTVTTLCPGPTLTNFVKTAHMENSRLFSGPMAKPMSSAEVARIGYEGLKSGRRVVITGLANKMTAMSARFSPKSVVLGIAASLNNTR